MKLSERIVEDMKAAMKAKDADRLEALRSLRAAMLELEKSGEEVTDEMEKKALLKQEKMRKESIEQYRNGGREDLVAHEEKALRVIDEYLPAKLSADELHELVERIAADVDANGMNDFKVVMPRVMKDVDGRADGSTVQAAVREVLTTREKQ